MNKPSHVIGSVQRVVALPQVLVLILALDTLGYFAGVTGWYGPVLRQLDTPMWAWPFIPDCPLFGLLGGLALLTVVAQQTWTHARRRTLQRWLVAGGCAATLAAAVYLCQLPPGEAEQLRLLAALYTLLAAALLLFGFTCMRCPAGLLCIVAAGQIKYGIWTITAWVLFWRNTAAFYGAPLITAEGVLMTVAHVGLALQGVLLLTYFHPTRSGALAALAWFALSDVVDYGPAAWGLGWHPSLPQIVPLRFVRNSTLAVTWMLGLGLLAWAGRRPRQPAQAHAAPAHPSHAA